MQNNTMVFFEYVVLVMNPQLRQPHSAELKLRCYIAEYMMRGVERSVRCAWNCSLILSTHPAAETLRNSLPADFCSAKH